MSCSSEAYLEGSSLPLATMASRSLDTARWLSGVHKGAQKVTVLAVFLMPGSWEGEVDKATLSTWEAAARLGTLICYYS